MYVGDSLAETYKHLKLVHLLLDIMDIVLAPRVTVSMTYLLEKLIVEHHKLFVTLFPAHNLIPKQHFLVHYPSKIRLLGPCMQYWSMRFEAKHASAKDFSRSVLNFKNICKSIAWQQQIHHCIDWLVPLTSARLDVGPGETVLPRTSDIPNNVFVEANISLYEEIYVVNHVKVNGYTYKPGHAVVIKIGDNHLPVFAQIPFIVIHNELCC